MLKNGTPRITQSYISNNIEAIIMGMLKMKENSAHSSRLAPSNTPTQIVEPERDMPGIIARPCIKPTARAVL